MEPEMSLSELKQRGDAARDAGRVDDALEAYDQVYIRAMREAILALQMKGVALGGSRLKESESAFREAIQLAEKLSQVDLLGNIWRDVGNAQLHAGMLAPETNRAEYFKQAEKAISRSIDELSAVVAGTDKQVDGAGAAVSTAKLAAIRIEQGRFDDALVLLSRAREVLYPNGRLLECNRLHVSMIAFQTARAHVGLNQWVDALHRCEEMRHLLWDIRETVSQRIAQYCWLKAYVLTQTTSKWHDAKGYALEGAKLLEGNPAARHIYIECKADDTEALLGIQD